VSEQPKRTQIIYRIAGCPACLKWNKVPAHWTRYLCGHCGALVEGVPQNTKPKPEQNDDPKE